MFKVYIYIAAYILWLIISCLSRKILWSEEQELMLCREMYQHKDGSQERGQCLDQISESLNSVSTTWFKVAQQALKDKIKKLLQLYVTKRNK